MRPGRLGGRAAAGCRTRSQGRADPLRGSARYASLTAWSRFAGTSLSRRRAAAPATVPVVPRLDPGGTHDRPPRREDLVEHPLERSGRKAQCDRIRLDRRAVLGPARGARPEQPPIRAAVAAIAVDDPPDRLERLEQGPARVRVVLGGESAEDRRSIDRLPAEPQRARPPARSAGRGPLAPGQRLDPRRSRRLRSVGRRGSVRARRARGASPACSRGLAHRHPHRHPLGPRRPRPRRAHGRRRAAAPGSVAPASAWSHQPRQREHPGSVRPRDRRTPRAARRRTARRS